MRALKQNPTAAVRAAAAGERVIVTERGRPVAQLLPISRSPLADLRSSGLARPPRRSIADLPEPIRGLELSSALVAMRADERY